MTAWTIAALIGAAILAQFISCSSLEEDGLSPEIRLVSPLKRIAPGQFLGGTFQPTVVSTADGVVHVFAQGRINSSEDWADKTIVYLKSADLGNSWTELRTLTPPGSFWGITGYITTNPQGGERINLLFTYSKVTLFEKYSANELWDMFAIRREHFQKDEVAILYRMYSDDGGETWSGAPVVEDFLGAVHSDGTYLPFFNPIGQVHRIEEGPKAGRLIIAGPVKFERGGPIANPSDIYDYKMQTSALIYSDDDGESWHLAGLTPEGGNEASAVAIDDGRRIIMIRRRNSKDAAPGRIVNYSDDFGETWTPNEYVQDMPSPMCLGVLFKDGDKLIFTQPALTQPLPRMPGWIGLSTNEGRTWTGKIIQKGLFSYSDIDRIPGTDIYALAYSHAMHGELGLYIRFFTQEWLVADQDR